MYKIEKNIPITSLSTKKYPFDEMEIGDSFLIPKEEIGNSIGKRANLAFLAKKKNIKISVRSEENGMRVWRIE